MNKNQVIAIRFNARLWVYLEYFKSSSLIYQQRALYHSGEF